MTEKVFTQCTVGGPVKVHVTDGKITKMRPIVFDPKEDAPSWTINARNKQFAPPRKTTLNSYVIPERTRVYSENRIKYPYRRASFNPNGERNTQNRGKDEYVRISWDEAISIVSSEIKRIREKYGPAAITGMTSSHHNWGFLHYKMGPFGRFFNLLGYTTLFDNPDSWEGWQWGSIHSWGFHWRLGHNEPFGQLEDALKHTEQIIYWSVDPNSTSYMYGGQDVAIWKYWLKELGVQSVFIDPYCNAGAAVWSDKWLAPRPGTDAALAEAIAYVWIKEETYDKWFIENRTEGFDAFKAHILGEKDGRPKTPQWAASECDIPVHTIYALARQWAAKRTMLAVGTIHGATGAARAAYGTEWARLCVLLMAMQGMGKPGVNCWGGASSGPPLNFDFNFPGYSANGWDPFGLVAEKCYFPEGNTVTQKCYRLLLPEAVLNPPISWTGEGFCGENIQQQFNKFTCPEPGPNGAPIKMIYRHGGSYISTMCDTNKWVRMYQSPNLEFVVMQDCHWQSETKFGDILLPASTNFEHSDISEWNSAGGYGHYEMSHNHRIIVYQHKCIEPLWESKPDYDIYCMLAEKLGFSEKYTEGNSYEDWERKVFEYSDLPKYTTFEAFKEKGYFVVPPKDPDKDSPVAFRWFYEGRACDTPDKLNPNLGTEKAHLLGTPSGKIEFVSRSLTEFDANDEERPPMPRYIPSWEGHGVELAQRFPLQLITPHPKHSFHTHNDNKTLWIDRISQHRIYKDGYYWWPVRINPDDAAGRDIKHGDIVKVFNDRGAVLAFAYVTERIRPGTVHSYEGGSKYDPLEPGVPGSIDRGGCMNLLTSGRLLSKNVPGMASNSCLVEISKWEK